MAGKRVNRMNKDIDGDKPRSMAGKSMNNHDNP